MRRRLKILLTEGSSLSARQVIYGLNKRHHIEILDPSRICQCRFSTHVQRYHRCPHFAADPLAYLSFLATRLKKGHYDVLIPTHDQVVLIARAREEIAQWVGIAVPPFETIDRVEGKAEFLQLLDELNIPHPESRVLQASEELGTHHHFPYFIKLSYGTAGQAVWKIENDEQLRRISTYLKGVVSYDSTHNSIIIQQPAKGYFCVAQAIFQRGRLIAAHTFRAPTTGYGGMATTRTPATHPIVVEHLQRMGRHLNWHGPLFLEYFYDPDRKRPEYIEANPRIGEPFNAFLNGVDMCDFYLRIALDEPMTPCASLPQAQHKKSHDGYMILASMALEGKSRRSLLREWSDMYFQKGYYDGSEDELTRPGQDMGSLFISLLFSAQALLSARMVQYHLTRTVLNYAMSGRTMETIRQLSPASIQNCFV